MSISHLLNRELDHYRTTAVRTPTGGLAEERALVGQVWARVPQPSATERIMARTQVGPQQGGEAPFTHQQRRLGQIHHRTPPPQWLIAHRFGRAVALAGWKGGHLDGGTLELRMAEQVGTQGAIGEAGEVPQAPGKAGKGEEAAGKHPGHIAGPLEQHIADNTLAQRRQPQQAGLRQPRPAPILGQDFHL